MTRSAAAVLVAVLLAAGCASRDDDDEATTATTAGGTATSSTEDLEATDKGVTAEEIRVAVIADVDNPIRPGLFEIAFDGMKAWESYVNEKGGLAGRRVRVDFLDSKLNPDEFRNSVIKACESSLAILGGIAVFDSQVDELTACGIPDIPANAISAEHRDAVNTYPVNPAVPGLEVVGAQKWYLENVDGCCKSVTLIPNQPIAREATIQQINAYDELGFDHLHDLEVAGEELNYTPIALAIKERGATYARSGLDYTSTVKLRKEAQVQGVTSVKVWDCSIQCYTPDLIKEGGSAMEGQYVWLSHVPFEEADEVEALQAYIDAVEKTGGKQGGFGLNAFAAGLLFERAVNAIVERDGANGLTRAALLGELKGIHDFDAEGIYGKTDVGGRRPSACVVIMKVEDGEFTRVFPDDPATLDCGEQNLHETHVVKPGGR